ncbi:glutamate-cysteine ligase family protein [Candidatus Viridilinea mediisalina]|uniref:Glutamate--cysteine ligase n=1 Tax=Candidatus Viridilinea mediisalina TaxID=2024553 RepID=A0A2A6RLL8_9CHLR|nr:glutamate-cysteine ligase family protein [Candidatus Viridilinea mediisalina]PDW03833.1 glutamate--cysteine ligase [Candidatus Viridilinea mediisalina]
MFRFGIEHEVAFIRADGQFADFANTSFAELAQLVAALPLYPEDYPALHVGDAGIRKKRWYVEGVERFDEAGQLCAFDAKGIEIRTTPQPTIHAALAELHQSYGRLSEVAHAAGFRPIALAFHPVRTEYCYHPPLNSYERQLHQIEPEYQTEHVPMLTFGPDFNLSWSDLGPHEVIDLGRKLTAYSPAIVPFSFNAPFYAGQLWEGLSVRTAIRTGLRPAVRVYLEDEADLIASRPLLTKLARRPQEVGRVEFKACDSCGDFTLYAGLLALLKGLALDRSLPERATTPDALAHQQAARAGLANPSIANQAATLLKAATQALHGDPDVALLQPLAEALARRTCPAQVLRDATMARGRIDLLGGDS